MHINDEFIKLHKTLLVHIIFLKNLIKLPTLYYTVWDIL